MLEDEIDPALEDGTDPEAASNTHLDDEDGPEVEGFGIMGPGGILGGPIITKPTGPPDVGPGSGSGGGDTIATGGKPYVPGSIRF